MAEKGTRKNRFVKAWVVEHANDHWVKEATRLGYRSRAAFKLLELAEKDRLFRPGMRVVDLGAAPGSWTQVLREKLGRASRIVALDVLRMAPLPGVVILQGDFREDEVLAALEAALVGHKVDLVVSDLAPNLSGIDAADQGLPGRRISGIPERDAGPFREGLRAQAEGFPRPEPRSVSGGKAPEIARMTRSYTEMSCFGDGCKVSGWSAPS